MAKRVLLTNFDSGFRGRKRSLLILNDWPGLVAVVVTALLLGGNAFGQDHRSEVDRPQARHISGAVRDWRLLSGYSIGCILEQEASQFRVRPASAQSPHISLHSAQIPLFVSMGAPDIPGLSAGSTDDVRIVAAAYHADFFPAPFDSRSQANQAKTPATDEKPAGPDHPTVARDLKSRALLYQQQGKCGEAESLYKRALAIDEKALGPEHPEVATDLRSLARLYLQGCKSRKADSSIKRAWAFGMQGRKLRKAEQLLLRALAIDEKALGPDHPQVAKDLNILSVCYVMQRKYRKAEPLEERALAIDEKALGPDHPQVAKELTALAWVYWFRGKYRKAEPLEERALAIDEKVLGPDHPQVAVDLSNLAGLYENQGKYADAEPLYRRALEIAKKALGPDHPEVAVVAKNLARTLRKLDRNSEARIYEEQAAEIRAKIKRHSTSGGQNHE